MSRINFNSSAGNTNNNGCSPVLFGVFWTLFSCVFVGIGLWSLVGNFQRSQWPTVPCEVEYLEITDSPNHDEPFLLETSFSYQWEGQSHTSNKAWIDENAKQDYIDLTDELELYRAGQLKQCSVNPKNPSEAILFTSSGFGDSWGPLVFTLFGGCFVAIGLGITFSGRRGKKGKSLSSKTNNKEEGKAIIIPFFGIFAAAGIGMLCFWVGPMWSKYFSAKSWEETPAVVIWSEVRVHHGDDSTTYSADIFYEYLHRGKPFKSNTVSLDSGSSSSGRAAKAEKVRAHPDGKHITCYVNPDNPHQALLERELGLWALWTLFPLPFAAVGLGGLWFTFKKTGKKALSSAATHQHNALSSGDYVSPYRENEEAGESAHVSFSPGKKRLYWLLGALAIAAFWNGIISVFVFQVVESWQKGRGEWFETLFMIPFLLVGIGLLIHALYRLLACFNPTPQLTLLPGQVVLGEPTLLQWSMNQGAHRLQHFAIYLVGEEEARYRRGTNTVTETAIFHEQPLLDTTSIFEMRKGTAEIELPLDTVPSWKAANNAIKWSLRVRGDIAKWPDIKDDYEITITPSRSHE